MRQSEPFQNLASGHNTISTLYKGVGGIEWAKDNYVININTQFTTQNPHPKARLDAKFHFQTGKTKLNILLSSASTQLNFNSN